MCQKGIRDGCITLKGRRTLSAAMTSPLKYS